MNIQPSREPIVSNLTPAPPAARIVVVLALPRELHDRHRGSRSQAAIQPGPGRSELELAHPLAVELDKGGHFQGEVFPVPDPQLGDPPISDEQLWRGCSGHSSSPPYLR